MHANGHAWVAKETLAYTKIYIGKDHAEKSFLWW